MQVIFYCAKCRKKFSVSDELAGKRIRCKECRHEMVIPAETELEEVAEAWIVECDKCGRSHKPPDEYEGKRIKCKCGEVIHLVRGAAAELRVQQVEPDPYEQGDLTGALPGLSAMDDPWSASGTYPSHAPATPTGTNYPWTPPPTAQVPPPNFSSPRTQGTVDSISPEQQRRLKKEREDKLLSRFDHEETQRSHSLGDSSDDSMFGAGAIGGLALIAAGAIWLVVGLSAGLFYPFPVIMIIAGIVSMIRSLL